MGKTQEQLNAEHDAALRAANPPIPHASPAKVVEPPVKPSPIPGDTFHERGPALREGTKTGPLPGDFPGRHFLAVAGFPSYETARTIVRLSAIAGIDGETAKLIEAALKD